MTLPKFTATKAFPKTCSEPSHWTEFYFYNVAKIIFSINRSDDFPPCFIMQSTAMICLHAAHDYPTQQLWTWLKEDVHPNVNLLRISSCSMTTLRVVIIFWYHQVFLMHITAGPRRLFTLSYSCMCFSILASFKHL